MKLNKRLKSSIIQTFFFNVVLLVVLLLVVVFKLWPSHVDIEAKKDLLLLNHNELEKIEKDGIPLKDFRTIVGKSEINQYLKEVIKSTNEAFYVRNFKNTKRTNFDLFIGDKKDTILEEKEQLILENKNEIVNKLLPIYISDSSEEEGMTDFDFINYVESILYAFNLVSTDSIGIGELKRVEEKGAEDNNLDSNMFYIPLRLSLTGQKSDILDFIHYFEYVASIDLDDGDIIVYNDKTISKKLNNEPTTTAYNIYEHQLSDIERISMDKYIDASSDPVKGDFVNFIKNTQKREKFSIEVDLRFYVQGLPDYKIESYVKGVLTMHSDLVKSSQAALKLSFDNNSTNTSSSLKAKNAIRSLSNILEMMEDDIRKLRVATSKKDQDLSIIYADAEEYNEKLIKIQTVLQESMVVLNSKK